MILKINFKKIKREINRIRFKLFENSILQTTFSGHEKVIDSAELMMKRYDKENLSSLCNTSDDPIVTQGLFLRNKVLQEYKNKLSNLKSLKLLIHVPEIKESMGGYSVFTNLIESLRYLGLSVEPYDNKHDIGPILQKYKPNVFIISDYAPFLAKLNWCELVSYKRENLLLFGLTASLEQYGNTPLPSRLKWAKEHAVDFYFSFRSQKYLKNRKDYRLFYDEGYMIVSIEFGVNPLVYYPVTGRSKDLNYVFLGSSNSDKWGRYVNYFSKITSRYAGFIDGPGWKSIKSYSFNSNRERYIYARAKIGLNLHLNEQIEWPCELNERTYMLAACGVPQLVDNPKLLNSRFSDGCLWVARNPKEYFQLFKYMLNNEEETKKAALKAQQEAFERHTTFQRCEIFALELQKMINGCEQSNKCATS